MASDAELLWFLFVNLYGFWNKQPSDRESARDTLTLIWRRPDVNYREMSTLHCKRQAEENKADDDVFFTLS